MVGGNDGHDILQIKVRGIPGISRNSNSELLTEVKEIGISRICGSLQRNGNFSKRLGLGSICKLCYTFSCRREICADSKSQSKKNPSKSRCIVVRLRRTAVAKMIYQDPTKSAQTINVEQKVQDSKKATVQSSNK
jgi:hypothetical protein